MRKHEDPRLSFSTPEFKEAQRTFTDGFKVCQISRSDAFNCAPTAAAVLFISHLQKDAMSRDSQITMSSYPPGPYPVGASKDTACASVE